MVNFRTMVESLKGLFKPSTVPYPYREIPPAEGYRGKPVYDKDKCIGCGACSRVCPALAITVSDGEGKRVVRVWYGHCAFCGRCEDSCPQEAIKLSRDYLAVSFNKEELEDKVELELARCPSCGSTFTTVRQLDKIFELVSQTLVKRGASLDEYRRLTMLCPSCRSKPAALMEAHRFMLKMG
ncbi:MAG: hypothetical protein DRJ97_05160 [Thermoprotei archaeon]|nr:MAG: hypothetical protein DRJ97_05295 [Thermoprotei archaeon]RLF14985.1 MAG: hypothetical protein DRJ97_05160 [Thermoprotei archaeon]